MFTVGPIAENTFIVRPDGGERGVIVDPGDEAPMLLGVFGGTGRRARRDPAHPYPLRPHRSGRRDRRGDRRPVWCPEIELPVLADPNAFMSFPGLPALRGYEAEHSLTGGEELELAGLEIKVLFTPGHSPGHLTYSIPDEQGLFSGDVLFQGSVGRVDLPGGDGPTLMESIRSLVDEHPPETTVYPGHMGITTLGAERASNPFLAELAKR